MDYITITGARTNNLKGLDVKLPKGAITVITGLSGSGKSSLAFDTIYAEGQRRYVENLSSYAKQVLGILNKPDIDKADGLIPAIAIDQKTIARSPRSTVGTLTEIYDYLRLIFARIGEPKCPNCHGKLERQDRKEIIDTVKKIITQKNFTDSVTILCPIIFKESSADRISDGIKRILNSKFSQVRINGKITDKNTLDNFEPRPETKYTIEIIYATHNIVKEGKEREFAQHKIISDLEKAITYSGGRVGISTKKTKEGLNFSENYSCDKCGIILPEISTRIFSFNSPHGACPECHGLGRRKYVDPNMIIPNQQLTLAEGAIRPWSRMANQTSWYEKTLLELSNRHNFDIYTPIADLSNENKSFILYGDGIFEGVVTNLERRYVETDSEYLRNEIEKYMVEKVCPVCNGNRLRKEALNIFIDGKNIAETTQMSVDEMLNFANKFKIDKKHEKIAVPIISEIKNRLSNLKQVGLSYITLDRQADSLAGGEAQRIRLATQLNGSLSGILYVLDEPSIGLHPNDITRLINTLVKLKQQGNTLIVVEHDLEIMKAADYIIDIGPLAGDNGGNIVAEGSYNQIIKNKKSLTSEYLSGRKSIKIPAKRRNLHLKESIKIQGANAYNLKNIDVEIPLKGLVCITGVSGSGKSTLVYEILGKKVAEHFHRAHSKPAEHKSITGLGQLDKAIKIDQTPIGRTPRSNLATYTGIFGPIRTLFASQSDAKLRGFNASHFSFNLKGGRCESCHGDGSIKVEMHFLPDVYITCEKCGGKRYNSEALEITVNDKTIADILEMTVDSAATFFKDEPQIMGKLRILQAVGLGYVKLGQSATTLSGGEAQRIKLATELSRSDTGKTLYILDEPTTGLHFEDVSMLLSVLQKLVDKGNTVLVIEHNLDIIKSADWVIDIGPGGGFNGGELVATGTPEQICRVAKSLTGKHLKKILI